MAANTNNDDEHAPIESAIIDEHKPNVDSSKTLLTESLGFESLNEKSKCVFNEHSLTAERRSRSNTTAAVTVTGFPPLITSLKKNGQPKFSLEKMRGNGRLLIWTVKNTRPDVFVARTPPAEVSGRSGGGRVRVKFIDSSSSSSGTDQ